MPIGSCQVILSRPGGSRSGEQVDKPGRLTYSVAPCEA